MNYREEMNYSKESKQRYIDGLNKLLLSKQKQMAKKRAEYCKDIFNDAEAYRQDFKKMLGWPLVDHCDTELPSVKSQKLAEEQGYTIYRLQFQIFDELEMTGLYFKANTNENRPLVLVQHGGGGTPELIAGFHGDTYNYNNMLERVIAHGVDAFAPQLLMWSKEFEAPIPSRPQFDARLKRLGSSLAAVELYCMTRVLDYFEAQEKISNFGMVGLSYGGFYTLFMAAIDTRIRSAISCAFFSTRDQYPWQDWTWFDAARHFDDAETACLVYPRRLCIEVGINDDSFDIKYGLESYEKLLELCKDVGTDWLTFIPFEGTHEFWWDDRPIKKMVEDLTAGQ